MNKLLYIIILAITFTHATIVNSADNNTTIKYEDQPPPSAISPSLSIGSASDVCVVVRSGAIGTGLFSASTGIHVVDKNCIMLKNARMLASLGLKVSATSLMCQDRKIFIAMKNAGTPCPVDGLIGKKALERWKELGVINEKDNVVGNLNVVHGGVNIPRRTNDYGQPTQ